MKGKLVPKCGKGKRIGKKRGYDWFIDNGIIDTIKC